MTYEEAKEIFETLEVQVPLGCGRDFQVARELAIEAIEKQIPKKVEIHEWRPVVCPTCGTELSDDLGDGYYRHRITLEVCPNIECCQRLDWGE